MIVLYWLLSVNPILDDNQVNKQAQKKLSIASWTQATCRLWISYILLPRITRHAKKRKVAIARHTKERQSVVVHLSTLSRRIVRVSKCRLANGLRDNRNISSRPPSRSVGALRRVARSSLFRILAVFCYWLPRAIWNNHTDEGKQCRKYIQPARHYPKVI